MVDIAKDRKSEAWVITRTDNSGFHHQLALTADEMDEITRLWITKI